MSLREPVKYYFADFVRKGEGGVPPKSVTPFSPKKIHKGGEGGTTQIRNLFFGPKSSVFEQKTQFLALFEDKIFRGKICKGGNGGTHKSVTPFLPKKKIRKEGGGRCTPLTDKIRKVVFDGLP